MRNQYPLYDASSNAHMATKAFVDQQLDQPSPRHEDLPKIAAAYVNAHSAHERAFGYHTIVYVGCVLDAIQGRVWHNSEELHLLSKLLPWLKMDDIQSICDAYSTPGHFIPGLND